jgi:hypothetical protein
MKWVTYIIYPVQANLLVVKIRQPPCGWSVEAGIEWASDTSHLAASITALWHAPMSYHINAFVVSLSTCICGCQGNDRHEIEFPHVSNVVKYFFVRNHHRVTQIFRLMYVVQEYNV